MEVSSIYFPASFEYAGGFLCDPLCFYCLFFFFVGVMCPNFLRWIGNKSSS